MPYLILIRHAETNPVKGISAHQWELTETGRRDCTALAAMLLSYQPEIIVTSEEPKAIATGQIIADALLIPCQTAPDLQETRRDSADLLDADQFRQAVHRAMLQPDKLLFGEETFAAAADRFLSRTDLLVAEHPGASLALVSHGRILSMVLARLLQKDPVTIWNALGMPAFAVLSIPDYSLVTLVNRITEPPL